jgi:uncharacterized protein YndB with AHSA1/START domain
MTNVKPAKATTVRVTRRFTASAERVFDAWLDVDRARRFLFATSTGQMVRAEIDPRVGGRFLFVDRRDGQDVEHFGTYLEIDRPRRLVFTFGVTGAEGETRVTIDIVPLGSAGSEAGCELTLTHEGVPEDYAERTEAGWGTIIEGMAGGL